MKLYKIIIIIIIIIIIPNDCQINKCTKIKSKLLSSSELIYK
jgi:hypothetical protein